jgi:MFS transporter, DHA1 family, multidrug resistance protein
MAIFYNTSRDQKKIAAGETRRPEDRLPIAMFGGVLFPATMFWFAWSGEYNSVHWIVPTLAGVFLAAAIMVIFVAYLNYLTDSYLMVRTNRKAAGGL